jgi:hypothetical protein
MGNFLSTAVAVLLSGAAWPVPTAAAPPAARELEQLWADLGTSDPVLVDQAMAGLVARPAQAVAFLGQRLRPAPAVCPRRLATWLAAVDSDTFAVREEATRELEELGETIEADLNRALRQGPSLEVRRRVERLLEKVRVERLFPPANRLRAVRAVEVLERVGDRAARRLLAALAGGAPDAQLTVEAKEALGRLTRKTPETP